MGTTARTLARNALLLVSSLVFCVLLLEVGLRIYNPFPFRVKGDKIVLTANRTELYRGSSPKFEPLITVTRNSIGFRGPNPPKDPHSVLSIVAVGGSTTECRFLSDKAVWTNVLSERLQDNFRPVWVGNAGLNGHSTFAHAVLLRDHVLPLHPRVVIFHIGGMDLGRTAPMGFDLQQQTGIRSLNPWDMLVEAGRSSELFATAYNLYRYSLARKARITDTEALDLASLPATKVSDAQIAAEKARHRQQFIPAYKNRVRGLVDAARAAGVIPVLMTQPMLWGDAIDDVTGRDLASLKVPGETAAPENSKLRWEVLEVYNEATRQVGAESDTLVIDVAHNLAKSSRNFLDDVHYTAVGAIEVGNIAAKSLTPYLAKQFPEFQATQRSHALPADPGKQVVAKGTHHL